MWTAPAWNAPPGVRAAFTLREGGASRGEFASLNLGGHVGDVVADLLENRRRLRKALRLPAEPVWLEQVHGVRVCDLDVEDSVRVADAAVAVRPHRVCAILVADCMPVLLASADGRVVGAAHAGWRGLAAGVLESTVAAMEIKGAARESLRAWLGPCIGPAHFEVGEEVRTAFVESIGGAVDAFAANERGRWQADLVKLATLRLAALGVSEVSIDGGCTYAEPVKFYSFRRDGRCGRMAALIWKQTG